MASNINRISGLASGMDTESMVKQLMQPYQAKVDKQKQSQTLLSWQQDSYRGFIKDFRSFYSKYFDVLSKDSIVSSKNYASTTATVSSGTSASISTLPGAKTGSYSVNVNQLASKPTFTSNGTVSSTDAVNNTDPGTTQLVISTDASNSFTVSLNGISKVSDLVSAINAGGKSLGVTASVSDFTGKLSIQGGASGAGSTLNIAGLDKLQFGASNVTFGTTTETGKDANMDVTLPDGTVINGMTSSSNSFAKDGVNFALNGTGSTAFNLQSNNQAAFDKIKGFVDDYNKLISNMKTKLTEKKTYNYLPLTDDQKAAMKDDDIKSWEEKGKQGILKNDNILSSIDSQLRGTLYTKVEGVGASLYDIGITTSSDTSKAGQLIIDETKLKSALDTDSTKVMNVLTQTAPSSAVTSTDINKNSGVFQRMKSIINDSFMKFDSPILKKAGYEGTLSFVKNDISDKIAAKQTIINSLLDGLTTKENSYYDKFAKLESAMNRSSSQQSWLTQQLGGK